MLNDEITYDEIQANMREIRESTRKSTALIDEISENHRKTLRYAKILAVECFVLGLLFGGFVMHFVLTR